jgi:flagellar hook-associated protein 1 FlgK
MSDLLSIGASGVRAYQTALSVVGENIANVGVAGYTRRVTQLSEVSAGVGLVERQGAGNGVLMTGVVRAGDAYATQNLRNASTDLARTETGATWLQRIEQGLTGNELSTRLTGFFTSATALAAEPTSAALRTGMISATQSAAIAFKATGESFDQMAADLDQSAQLSVQTLNSLAASLMKVNDGLGRTLPNTAATAQLGDQRDQILEQMSAITDIGVTTDSLGRATVSIGGAGGATIVKGEIQGAVGYARTGGNVVFTVTMPGGLAPTVVTPSGGVLAGVGEAADRIASAREELNTLATAFVADVNAVQVAGKDQDNVDGTALIDAPTTNPTDMTLLFTEGSKIAAAKPTATKPFSVRDGSNLVDLAKARTDGGYEAKLTALINGNATAYKQKSVIADAQTAIRNGASTALTSAAGVNIDSEALDLMRFQQAYQASSRVIQAARDTFQSILEIR